MLLAGCGRSGEFVLHQPFAPPAQQDLELVRKWAFHALEGDRRACFLGFPLPGAKDGPRTFVLYVSSPDELGELSVDPDDPQGVQGFLIQELGHLAGRTDFVSGTVRYRKVWLRRNLCRLEVDVRCADGTEITGQACLERKPREMRAFERRFAADVAELRAPTLDAGQPRRTGPRAVGSEEAAQPDSPSNSTRLLTP